MVTMGTVTHPRTEYWLDQGIRHARSGMWSDPDPELYAKLFGEPHPPVEWLEAFRTGQRLAIDSLI